MKSERISPFWVNGYQPFSASTNEYIRKIKMQLAEKYLLEGKYSISEIAFKVGINSNVYFRQCFKEEFGMSASDYLKQLTGKSIDEKVDE